MPTQPTQKQFGDFKTELQPDYKYSHNGYGLLQLTANFKRDIAYAASSDVKFDRGATFPDESTVAGGLSDALKAESWTCIKADETGSDGRVMTVTAHYAAIALTVGGEFSQIEANITSSATSEAIETHPNFTEIQVPRISPVNPLGGVLGPSGPPTTFDKATNPFRAKWLPSNTAGVASWQFYGFIPANKQGDEFNRKAGIKNYFRPSITLKLTGYTTNAASAVNATNKVGWKTQTGFDFMTIPAPYTEYIKSDLDFHSKFGTENPQRDWLCTGSNMEVFGGLYKCSLDLMLSGIMGWDPDVYPQ